MVEVSRLTFEMGLSKKIFPTIKGIIFNHEERFNDLNRKTLHVQSFPQASRALGLL